METGGRPLSDIPAINRFLSYCRIRTVPSKTVVIHAGDLPDVLYYIISGSVEVMIALGVADAIVDLVETGSTLKRAGLELFGESILTSAERLWSVYRTAHPRATTQR